MRSFAVAAGDCDEGELSDATGDEKRTVEGPIRPHTHTHTCIYIYNILQRQNPSLFATKFTKYIYLQSHES